MTSMIMVYTMYTGLTNFGGKSTRSQDLYICSSESLLDGDFIYKTTIKMKRDKNQNENKSHLNCFI